MLLNLENDQNLSKGHHDRGQAECNMMSMEKTLVTEMPEFNQKVSETFAGLKERTATFMFK